MASGGYFQLTDTVSGKFFSVPGKISRQYVPVMSADRILHGSNRVIFTAVLRLI